MNYLENALKNKKILVAAHRGVNGGNIPRNFGCYNAFFHYNFCYISVFRQLLKKRNSPESFQRRFMRGCRNNTIRRNKTS